MNSLPFEHLLQTISQQSNLTVDVLTARIGAKMEQLNGLVSREGAAHIIANELGISLQTQSVSGMIKISSILPGMRSVETVGRVMAVYGVREFQKGNNSGKVGSCIIADETGTIRVTCWHAQTDALVHLKVDDIVRVVGAYVRDNNNQRELHLNDQSRFVVNPPNITMPEVQTSPHLTRKKIQQLAEFENNVELFGTVVQVYDPRFFEICPECKKRARAGESGFACENHGTVKPLYSYVMNAVLDDGSESCRIVCFKDQANELTARSEAEFLECKDDAAKFEAVKNELLGMQIIVAGRVQKNVMFDRLEFVSQKINRTPDLDEEIARLDQAISAVNSP